MSTTTGNSSSSALPQAAATEPTPPITQTSTPPQKMTTHELPDEPLVTIQPSKTWRAVNLRELWDHRELLFFLVWRDLKVRYKQTALGVAWAIIQPLFTMLIFTLFFGKLAGIGSDGVPYPIFAYVALLPWTFFANAITNGSNSLVGDSRLITKVYFPRMIIPVASVGAGLLDFAIASVFLVGLMVYYHIGITWNLAALPLLILLLTMLSMGVGILMAGLNIKYRDVRYTLPLLIQLWMFASPVIYPLSIVPERWKWVVAINPMAGIIEGFRSALLGRNNFDWTAISVSAIISVVVLVCSTLMFRRMEKGFADIV
jgi:lipopolysaccharide transport system permease protein